MAHTDIATKEAPKPQLVDLNIFKTLLAQFKYFQTPILSGNLIDSVNRCYQTVESSLRNNPQLGFEMDAVPGYISKMTSLNKPLTDFLNFLEHYNDESDEYSDSSSDSEYSDSEYNSKSDSDGEIKMLKYDKLYEDNRFSLFDIFLHVSYGGPINMNIIQDSFKSYIELAKSEPESEKTKNAWYNLIEILKNNCKI